MVDLLPAHCGSAHVLSKSDLMMLAILGLLGISVILFEIWKWWRKEK